MSNTSSAVEAGQLSPRPRTDLNSPSTPMSSHSAQNVNVITDSAWRFLEWTEDEVVDWLKGLGYGQYQAEVLDQGVTGDVLPHLTHESLMDLGIKSVGHRLGILKAIYTLKLNLGQQPPASATLQDNDESADMSDLVNGHAAEISHSGAWEWSEDDWRPVSDAWSHLKPQPVQQHLSSASIDGVYPSSTHFAYPQHATGHALAFADTDAHGQSQSSEEAAQPHEVTYEADTINMLWEVVSDQSHRIATLEQEYRQLLSLIPVQARDRLVVPALSPTLASKVSNGQAFDGGHGRSPSSLLQAETAIGPQPSSSTSSASRTDTSGVEVPSMSRLISSTGLIAEGSISPKHPHPTSSPAAEVSHGDRRDQPRSPLPGGDMSLSREQALPPSYATNETSQSSAAAAAQRAAGAAAKSFKVTLDDPCWKVLPAALKKYKINDDWRQYAMFICYGNTERCLSLDEKPLLLFQKLKESNQKPVFMLRPMREIQSPIALAEAKQQARAKAGLVSAKSRDVPQLLAPETTAPVSASVTKAVEPAPSNAILPADPVKGYSTNTRLHRPPVLQPISAKARAATAASTLGSGKTTPGSGNQLTFPDIPSPGGTRTAHPAEASLAANGAEEQRGVIAFAVAIYPYSAEREDELDVSVGMAFVVRNKAKGWWIVQRDPAATGDVNVEDAKSGWVPSGCLLEMTQAALSAPPDGGRRDATPDSQPLLDVPIQPSLIASSSFQGIALMDYEIRGKGELALKSQEPLRVL